MAIISKTLTNVEKKYEKNFLSWWYKPEIPAAQEERKLDHSPRLASEKW
jgi:hypothetical protein